MAASKRDKDLVKSEGHVKVMKGRGRSSAFKVRNLTLSIESHRGLEESFNHAGFEQYHQKVVLIVGGAHL